MSIPKPSPASSAERAAAYEFHSASSDGWDEDAADEEEAPEPEENHACMLGPQHQTERGWRKEMRGLCEPM